jgi:hypothetical protein
MKSNSLKFVDLCPSDGLPCSCSVKGVGIGFCFKSSRGKMIICCRFSDVSPSVKERERSEREQ